MATAPAAPAAKTEAPKTATPQAAPAAQSAAVKKAAAPREAINVTMKDGRTVEFVGKRRLLKETLIDSSKIKVDGDTLTMKAGAVRVRLDLRNGHTITYTTPLSLIAKQAGHGGEQKLGDEVAGADKIEDMILDLEDLAAQLEKGEWSTVREAGGFSGASVVIRAIMEASGKPMEYVKTFLQGKLDAAKAKGEALSRKALYDSFRNPNSKVGQIVKRLEDEERAGKASIDADAALAEMK